VGLHQFCYSIQVTRETVYEKGPESFIPHNFQFIITIRHHTTKDTEITPLNRVRSCVFTQAAGKTFS